STIGQQIWSAPVQSGSPVQVVPSGVLSVGSSSLELPPVPSGSSSAGSSSAGSSSTGSSSPSPPAPVSGSSMVQLTGSPPPSSSLVSGCPLVQAEIAALSSFDILYCSPFGQIRMNSSLWSAPMLYSVPSSKT